MSIFAGVKGFAKFTGKGLNTFDQKSEAFHDAFIPIDVNDKDTHHDPLRARREKTINQFKALIEKGNLHLANVQTISALVDAVEHPTAIDDRLMLLEHAIVALSHLPQGDLSQKLQNKVIELLYYDLPHPPATYTGKVQSTSVDGSNNQFQFRSADGSGNNVSIPDMGKAGSTYSRSVQATHTLVASELPDADLVYKSLLKRDKFEKHPGGLSSLMFGFATLVIHSIFRTSFTDPTVNETSSYIDLAPLYGNNQEMQDRIRDKTKDSGLLHPDTFAEDRLLLLPPATSTILVLFNRNHNYIAKKLCHVNERGWKDPTTLSKDDRLKQDDEIFNTARLVNCMWFAQVVFSDYFSAILGLVRDGSTWNLNPFGQIRKPDHSMVERGQGNSVSAEFNLLYRWHATMSEANVQWTEDEFKKVFNTESFDTISPKDFGMSMRKVQANLKAPHTWTFDGLERVDGGGFKDEDLANILKEATSHPASAFKARGSPHVMQVIEVMGIEQARSSGVCSLNDFRRFLGLKPYANFKEWNEDDDVAETARKLYGDIENLELYPGLQAEQPKQRGPGAGLCPGYTISRAILSDAIALTRGDRFYTTDLTPWNLTAWGFQDCQRDTTNAGFGSMLGRLLLRTLPNHYTYDSVYTWFALMTPEEMKTDLTKLGIAERYSFEEPNRTEHPQVVDDFSSVSSILKDRTGFNTPYVERAKELIPGQGYLLSLDDPAKHKADWELIHSALAGDAQVVDKAAQFYFDMTKLLIKERSYTLPNHFSKDYPNKLSQMINIVDEVLNLVPIHFVSIILAGFPLKTEQNPQGIYQEGQLLQMLRDVFAYIFFEGEPAKRIHARKIAKRHTEELLNHIKRHLRQFAHNGDIFYTLIRLFQGSHTEPEFLKRVSANKRPIDELANDVFSVVLLSSVEFSQTLINMINLYLDHEEFKNDILGLLKGQDAVSDAQFQRYAREALRLDPAFRGTFRHPQRDVDGHGVKINKNRPVYLSFANANTDPTVFPNPDQVDPSRPTEGYLSFNSVVFGTLGDEFAEKMAAQVLKAVFSLKNLRRTPKSMGSLRRVPHVVNGTTHYQYLDGKYELSPWASSMILEYDLDDA